MRRQTDKAKRTTVNIFRACRDTKTLLQSPVCVFFCVLSTSYTALTTYFPLSFCLEKCFWKQPTEICPLQATEVEEDIQDFNPVPASSSSFVPLYPPPHEPSPLYSGPQSPVPHQRYPTLAQSDPDWLTPPGPQKDGTGHTSHSDYVQSAHCRKEKKEEDIIKNCRSQVIKIYIFF